MSAINFELKQINGVPYYIHESTVYTFELDAGRRSERSAAIGTYDAASERITYYPDWRERVQSNLERFRDDLSTQDRERLRDTITKPIKSRKPSKNSRRPRVAKNTSCN